MKKLIGLLGILSVMAIAGTISDLKFLSDTFMDGNKEIATAVLPAKRQIASDYEVDSDSINLPVNEENRKRINGIWTAKRYTFNFDEGEELNLKIKLELVGNARVMIEDDETQILKITKLTDNNEMRLVAELNGGREVLDVVLEKEEKKQPAKEVKEVVEVEEEVEKEKTNFGSADLVLVSVQNPSKNKIPQTGSEVSGNILVIDGYIEDLNVNTADASISLSGVEIKTAGIFNADYDGQPVSGRYSVAGEENVTVRFFSGPLASTVVEFATEDVRENKLEAAEASKAEIANEKESLFAGEVVYDRTTDKMEYIAETPEEMDAVAEESGYSF